MGGRRITKDELGQMETLTEEGLTTREIAEKLDRSQAAIRNLRYKNRLVSRAKNETRRLFQQKDKLKNEVEALQNRKASLKLELEGLKIDKKKLEDIILMDRFLLEQTLSQALINLKAKRPDLFTLTKADQIGLLLKAILW
jgi:ribosomal protein L28